MREAVTPWIHIVAVAAWVGPQFFMFLVTAPALRAIPDLELRLRVMQVISYRFGWLAWTAMAVIVLSGISNLFQRADEFGHVFDPDYRYFQIFATKMVLVGLMVLLTGLHTFVVGPRQLRLMEAQRSSASSELARLRRTSIALSSLALLASIAVVFAGALLSRHEYSFQPV